MDRLIDAPTWQQKWMKPGTLIVLAGVILAGCALLNQTPTLDRSQLLLGQVQRGPFVWHVEGTGVLTATRTVVLTAPASAHIEETLLDAGAPTDAGSAILKMSSSENEATLARLQGALKLAELELQVAIQDGRMSGYAQDIAISRADSAVRKSAARIVRERQLADRGITSALTLDQLEIEHQLLEAELQMEQRSRQGQLALVGTREQAARAKVDLLTEELRQAVSTRDALVLRAPGRGQVQKILYTPGSAISSGTAVAEWADLSEMRAVIKVPEWEAAEVQVGQSAEVLLGGERFPFKVARIDPAVADGVIGVELAALGTLPSTARINASVEGRILIKELDDTLSITRPTRLGRNSDTVSLYRFDEASKLATRVDVRFGARSSSHAQIVEGLSEGSWVILTDLAAADSAAEIRLQ